MQSAFTKVNPVFVSTKYVVERAKDVRIDKKRISGLAKEWVEKDIVVPRRSKEDTLENVSDRTLLDYLFLLDTTNFCFWSRKEKWNIEYRDKRYDGYFALSLALKKFFKENAEKANLEYFSKISYREFTDIFRGKGELQLLKERWQYSKAVSNVLLKRHGGDSRKFIESGKCELSILVPKIAKELPSFNDIAIYNGKKVYLWKRAQILGADIYFAFKGKGLGVFKDPEYLTAMADYKLPQILYYWEVLSYSRELENKIKNRILIVAGSKEEVEIRTATIWAVEYLKEELAKLGKNFYAFEIDWILWDMAQNIKMKLSLPAFGRIKNNYHLTKTVYY